MNFLKHLFFVIFLFSSLLPLISHALEKSQYQQLESIIEQVSQKTSYSTAELEELFRSVEIQPRIIEIMDRPAESLPWYKYRKLFVTEKSIENGVAFWKSHEATLQRAAEKYGVPPEIIVATLGVETRYGTNTGSYRVIDALATLAFEYPRRSKYFTRELTNFLLLTDAHKLSPLEITGSYAGAIGLPQFMPSSYLHYAVDFSNDGYSDLVNNVEDAIGSIASYYSVHGWKTGEPVSWSAARVDGAAGKQVTAKRKTNSSLGKLRKAGVVVDGDASEDMPAALIELEGENGNEYRVAFDNFFVITRYNTSKLYATAVQLLAEEIRSRVQRQS